MTAPAATESKTSLSADLRRATIDRAFPGEWALGLTIACRHDREHQHAGKPCEPRSWGTRVLEKGHPKNASERFRIGLALRDEHLDRIAAHVGNVALHLPYNVFAIDCDNTAAVDLFAREDTPMELRTSASGERKAHVIWRLPPGIRMKGSTRCKLPVGGEVAEFDIRGMEKTVIIAAPSHHRDGNDYRWAIPLPPNIEDVPVCPDETMQLLRAGGARIMEDEDGLLPNQPAEEQAAEAGHDVLLRYTNRWAPRVRTVDELFRLADAAVDRVYAGRPDRAAAVREPGGELSRIVDSAWQMFGGKSPLDEEQTDKGRALAHRTHFGETCLYEPRLRNFLRFDGVKWDEVSQKVVERDFVELEEAIFEDAQWAPQGAQRDQLVSASRALRAGATRTRAAVAMSQQYQCSIDDFDTDPDLLAFPDGRVVNLRTGEWGPVTPEHRITHVMGAPFDPKADMSEWYGFLNMILDTPEQGYLQRLVGMSALGSEKENIIPFLHGTGGSGKSTFINAVRRGYGGYGLQASFRSVVRSERSAGAATADLYAWRGKRFVALDEIEEGQKLGGISKSLTGDERIAVRGLYRDEIEIPITWTMLGQGNKQPQADPTDPGLKRRIVEIPFERVLQRPKHARDLKWVTTQPRMLQAIGLWIVQGCLLYQRDGLVPTEKIAQAQADYWAKQDAMTEWIEESCAVGEGLECRRDELWQDFDAWQQDHLHPKERLSSRVFNARLKERFGPPSRRGSKNSKYQIVFGIELLGVPGTTGCPPHVPGSVH